MKQLRDADMRAALEGTTTALYDSGTREWLRYCNHYRLNPNSRSDDQLSQFMAFEHKCGVGFSGVRNMFYSIRNYWVLKGLSVPATRSFLMTMKLFHGYKKAKHDAQRRPKREPITINDLTAAKPVILQSSEWDGKLFFALATCMAYSAARPGELLTKSINDPAVTLKQLAFLPLGCTLQSCLYATITIRTDKIDKVSNTVTLTVPKTSTLTCPVTALWNMLEDRKRNSGKLLSNQPIFLFNGTALLYDRFRNWLHILSEKMQWDPNTHKPHSFRIGAATLAARLGMPEYFLKALGRWRSEAYQRYIRMEPRDRAAVSSKLADGEGIDFADFDADYLDSLASDSDSD